MQDEEGNQREEEDIGARSPAQLLRKLIYYTQFHDMPEEPAQKSEDKWDFSVPEGGLQVQIPS